MIEAGRPSRNEVLWQTAEAFAQRSTCSRGKVGVVVAQDGRVLVTGYNGAPRGMPHCDHACSCLLPHSTMRPGAPHGRSCPMHSENGCKTAVHAEANAVAYSAYYGIGLKNAELYTTTSPCLYCAMLIVNCGIIAVHCARPYRDMAGLDLLRNAGIELYDRMGRTL